MQPNWPLLGLVRFLLALNVMLCHVFILSPHPPLQQFAFLFGAFSCVASFMICSGFSIAHSLERDIKGFCGRRIDRIAPVYFVCLVLSFVPYLIASPDNEAGALLLSSPPTMRELLVSAIGFPGVFAEQLDTNGATWSLGVEIFIHALAPLLLRIDKRKLILLFSGLAVLYIIQSSGWPFGVDVLGKYGVWNVIRCSVWWLVGWFLYHNRNQQITLNTVFVFVGIACLFAANPQQYHPTGRIIEGDIGPLVIALVGMACMFGQQIILSEKAKKVSNWLGDVSYPLYLVHMPLFWILAICGFTSTLATWFSPIIALVVAAIVLHSIDYPYKALCRRRQARATQISIPFSTAS